MASLTPVPVTLPEDKVPTKQNIRDIIGTFLTEEWPTLDLETLTMSYHASFANAHCPVERPKPKPGTGTGTPMEPLKVFIKSHSGNDTGDIIELFKNLAPSKQEEALLCYEYGQSGLGANVYGSFETRDGTLGRIDEFLDARDMEPEDVEKSVIRADVAKGLAMFHVLKTALEKKPVELYYEAIIDGLAKYYMMDKLKVHGKEGGISVDRLVDYDFATRVRKVVDKLESIGGKAAWCIHDIQFGNVMVKNHPKDGESSVALIDFELEDP